MRTPLRIARALAAQLTLLACLVGLPWLLAASVGDPLHGLGALRSGQVSDTVVIDLLTCLAYLCWAQFTLAVLAEVAHVLHHRPRIVSRPVAGYRVRASGPVPTALREPLAVPGPLRGQQQVAHRLVVAALMLTPVVTSFTLASHLPALAASPSAIRPTAAVSAARTSTASVKTAGHAAPAGSAHVYVVPDRGGPATYWDLAATYLGSGEHWEQIWQLNQGRTQADGSVMDSPNLLRPGWTVILPATTNPRTDTGTADPRAALHAVTVHPGDTLSGLAAADGITDWTTVWPANHDHPEPDGQRFTDPNQIRPGWSVLLPDQHNRSGNVSPPPKQGPTHTPPANPTPTKSQPPATSHSTTPPQGTPTPTTPRGARPRPSNTATAPADPPVSTAPGSAQPSPVKGSDTPAGRPSGATSAGDPDSGSTTAPAPRASSTHTESIALVFSGTGALLAGLSLTVLARRRRRQQRHRRPGRSITEPPARLHSVERGLAVRPGVTSTDAQWLTRALRHLATTTPPDRHLPDLAAAQLAPDGAELILASPSTDAPAGWTVEDAGHRWRLPRSTVTDAASANAGDPCLPYPALTSIGVADDTQWMLDLEHLRTLTIRGPAEQRRNLLRHLAAELAHNSWSDHVHISLVGVGHELAPIDPARLSCHHSLDTAIAQLRAHLAGIDDAAAEENTTILNARLRGVAADAWTPHVLIVDDGAGVDATVNPSIDHAPDPAPQTGPDSAGVSRSARHDGSTRDELAALVAELDARTERCGIAVIIGADRDEPATPRSSSGQSEPSSPANGQTNVDLSRTSQTRTGQERCASRLVTIDADARLRYWPLDLSVTACQLTATEAADLAELLRIATDLTDRPMPDARGDAHWEQHADAAGAPRQPATGQPVINGLDVASPEQTVASQQATLAPHNDHGSVRATPAPAPASRPLLALPDAVYLTTTAATETDLELLAPPLPEMTREQIAHSDTELDTDLAAWHDPTSTTPKLRLLGPITLSSSTDPPEGRAALITELIAYLLTRPHGVTVEELAAAIWPHIPDAATKTTPRQSVSLARQWLGVSPRTRRERLPRASADPGGSKVYRITDVLVDADLFRRLRLRATTRGPDGITDLQAALDLVAGPPFAQQRPGGYGWLAEIPLHHEYSAMIVDVAHLVATHHLSAGNPQAAAAAARVSLLSEAGDDVALLDLLAAAEAQGDHTEARHYLTRILTNNDAEVEEDLPPRTYEILLRLTDGFEASWVKSPPGSEDT